MDSRESNSSRSSRRQFLQSLLWALAAGSAGLSPNGEEAAAAGPSRPNAKAAPSGTAPSARYKLSPWTGDDFTRGHRLRDGEIPICPTASERTVDFVIVGGGMAGLSSAYFLGDHDYLLLEQYDELGGQSRGRSYRGIDYSLGTAYMGSNDGIFGQLFADLGIKPVTLPPTKNSFYWEGRWLPGIKGSDQSLFYKELDRLVAQCRPIWKSMPAVDPRLPMSNPDLLRLDSVVFASILKGYDPKFLAILDTFCKSSCCGGINQLSALAGVALAEDLVTPSYVFKGGNPAIARALRAAIEKSGKGRTVPGAFVWRVNTHENGASVVYSTADGATHKVNCRHVIVTAPPLVAARILPDLDDRAKGLLLWHKYGSYLVANFCMKKKVFNSSYDSWVESPFTFADITIAETPYMALGQYKKEMGSVLTVYQPYTNASPGRALLMAGNREEFAASLTGQMAKIVPQFQNNLEEVVLTRWGHAMTIARPGMFAKLGQLAGCDTGPITLAHSSTEGMPSAESAITAARRAADRALKVASTKR